MNDYYRDDSVRVIAGDCLNILRTLPDNSVDSVCTDPPYGLEFMGKQWDKFGKPSDVTRALRGETSGLPTGPGSGRGTSPTAGRPGFDLSPAAKRGFQEWCELWATECLRVLKPGGHLLAFGGTRTSHRLACAVEDAGFEIRDSIAWLYGSGFPKSLDVGKAIDKAAGAERTERTGVKPGHEKFVGRDNLKSLRESGALSGDGGYSRPWMHDPEKVEAAHHVMAPATDAARTWDGWGTALKPAHEPIIVARKPLTGTVAANVLGWGTGALNIDGCRLEHGSDIDLTREQRQSQPTSGMMGLGASGYHSDHVQPLYAPGGRWPANVVLDESQAAALDQMSGPSQSRIGKPRGAASGDGWGMTATGAEYADTDGASRFFYTAKADASERVRVDGVAHPTVKPLSLMRWLTRLVTPPGGTVLEPFAGSGTTVEACILEGFRVIAIEREPDYLPLIVQRINRRRNPVAAVRADGGDGGLFDLLDGGAA